MAARFVLSAVAEQRHVAPAPKGLEEPQRELLTVVLDPLVASVDTARLLKFSAIATGELAPQYLTGPEVLQKALARAEVSDPRVTTRLSQAAPMESSDKDAETVLAAVDT